MAESATSYGTITLTYMGSEEGYQYSLGYYLVDEDTGEILSVEIPFQDAHDIEIGSSVDIDVPDGVEVSAFIVADSEKQTDFAALGPGTFSFVDTATGGAATLKSADPKLIHTATDGTVTPITGKVWHSAGYGENVALNSDDTVHTRGISENPDGSWDFSFENRQDSLTGQGV